MRIIFYLIISFWGTSFCLFGQSVNIVNRSLFPYDIIDSSIIDLDNDSKLDTILLAKYSNWDDPGDFHIIIFKFGNKKETMIENINGWVFHEFLKDYYIPSKYFSQITKYFVTKDFSDVKLFILEGYLYASSPPGMTLLEISNDSSIKIVIDEELFLKKISYKDNVIEIIGTTKYVDDDRYKGIEKKFIIREIVDN